MATDRERLAKALYEELCVVGLIQRPGEWRALPDATQECYRCVARNLLLDGVRMSAGSRTAWFSRWFRR